MFKILGYYNRFEGLRGGVAGLPGWARFLLLIAALPGIVLMGLSILAFVVSLLTLLLLTMPVYRLIQGIIGAKAQANEDVVLGSPSMTTPGRRHVDVKIVE